MTITDPLFASQLTTVKGRQYIFDDLSCMTSYKKENTILEVDRYYVADFCNPLAFIDLEQAILLRSDSLRSPMNGNIAAFAIQDSAMHYKTRYDAMEVLWADLLR
jgi:copper chaperone NosL